MFLKKIQWNISWKSRYSLNVSYNETRFFSNISMCTVNFEIFMLKDVDFHVLKHADGNYPSAAQNVNFQYLTIFDMIDLTSHLKALRIHNNKAF